VLREDNGFIIEKATHTEGNILMTLIETFNDFIV